VIPSSWLPAIAKVTKVEKPLVLYISSLEGNSVLISLILLYRGHCQSCLRQYTYRFARHMVELFPKFLDSKPARLLPAAPSTHGSNFGLFLRMFPFCFFKDQPELLNIIALSGNQVSEDKSVLQLFKECSFDERWDECCDLQDLLVYCRGSKRLRIPPGRRDVLPCEL
jgi:hypothetical protein